jgi:hypothetical protein
MSQFVYFAFKNIILLGSFCLNQIHKEEFQMKFFEIFYCLYL